MPRLSNPRKATAKAGQVGSRMREKTTSTKSKAKSTPKDDLMEFEQFIAQKKSMKKSNQKGFMIFTMALLFIALSLMMFGNTKKQPVSKPLVFKTIYLESGQQLYAKIVKEDALYLYLDDVYYTKKEAVEVPPQEEGGEPQIIERTRLISRGNELVEPTGLMQVNRVKVFAIDEMGKNSEIMRLINEIKTGQ